MKTSGSQPHSRRKKLNINLRSLLSSPSTTSDEQDRTCVSVPLISSGAARMRRYRSRLRSDAAKYEQAKETERQRSFLRRHCLTEEQQNKQREQSRIRMQKYRLRQQKGADAASLITTSPPCDKQKEPERMTRAAKQKEENKLEEQRRKRRERKRAERARMSGYKRRWVREKNRLRMQKKREEERARRKCKISVDQSPPSTSSYSTGSSKRKAAQRIKKNLPKSPRKFAAVISHLVRSASPRKKAALRTEKFSNSPKIKQQLSNVYKCLKDAHRNLQKKNTICKNPRKSFMWNICSKISKKYRMKRTISKEVGIRYKTLLKYSELTSCPCSVKRRSDATSYAIQEKVRDFYVRPDVSSCMPNKKVIGKKLEPKYVIQSTLSTTCDKWKQENPSTKLGFRKFSMLRPQNVLTQKHTKLYQCLCEYCTNIEFKLKIINQQAIKYNLHDCKITDKYEALNLTCCVKDESASFHKKACILRECPSCGVEGLSKHLTMLDEHGDVPVTWLKWKSESVPGRKQHKMILTSENGTLREMVIQLADEMKSFALHIFNAQWQHQQYVNITCNPPSNTVVCVLDFAENYTCLYQHEIQSAYWGKTQVTIHPIVAQYQCQDDGALVRECIDIVSSDLKHDSHAVACFTRIAYNHLVNVRKLSVKRVVQFTDGCAGQYKSKTPFIDLSYSKQDYGFPTERHFFGSRHGKGPCDGEGGVLKKAAERAVKSEEFVITDAESFFRFCQEKLAKPAKLPEGGCNHSRRVFYLVTDEINRNRPDRDGKTLAGTRKIHCITGVSPGNVKVRSLSCFCAQCESSKSPCLHSDYTTKWKHKDIKVHEDAMDAEVEDASDHAEEENRSSTVDAAGVTDGAGSTQDASSSDAVEMSDYIAVRIMGKKKHETYMAQVLANEGETLRVKYLKEVAPNQYIWPSVDDIWALPVGDVLCKMPPPVLQAASSTRLRYSFNNSTINEP